MVTVVTAVAGDAPIAGDPATVVTTTDVVADVGALEGVVVGAVVEVASDTLVDGGVATDTLTRNRLSPGFGSLGAVTTTVPTSAPAASGSTTMTSANVELVAGAMSAMVQIGAGAAVQVQPAASWRVRSPPKPCGPGATPPKRSPGGRSSPMLTSPLASGPAFLTTTFHTTSSPASGSGSDTDTVTDRSDTGAGAGRIVVVSCAVSLASSGSFEVVRTEAMLTIEFSPTATSDATSTSITSGAAEPTGSPPSSANSPCRARAPYTPTPRPTTP